MIIWWALIWILSSYFAVDLYLLLTYFSTSFVYCL